MLLVVLISTLLALTTVFADVEDTTIDYNGYRYTFLNNPATWSDAEQNCRDDHDGHLASIHDWNEFYLIQQLRRSANAWNYPVWIGGSFQGNASCSGDDGTCKSDEYLNSDFTPTTLSFWAPNEKANRLPGTCISLNQHNVSKTYRDKLHAQSCNDSLYYICKAWIGPISWKSYKECLYGLRRETLRWSDANQECELLGGRLASIHSADEHAFISNTFRRYDYGPLNASLLTSDGKVVSLNLSSSPEDLWIGAVVDWANRHSARKIFYWIDYSKLDFTNWGGNIPANPNTTATTDDDFANPRVYLPARYVNGAKWLVADETSEKASICKICTYDASKP